MAEVLGVASSVVTLTALFKTCVEAFDMFRTAQNQAIDLKKLTLRLNIEKCRLYTWGQAMGLTPSHNPKRRGPLDRYQYSELVYDTLELIIKTLSDSSKLRNKYGCRGVDARNAYMLSIEAPTNVFQQLNTSFDNFKIKSERRAQQAAQKTYWVIHDRQKFEALIWEAKGLIDGLQEITKAVPTGTSQQEIMGSRIRRIEDVRTLDWISEVCEAEYPLLSGIASSEAESLSENRTLYRDIQHWKDSVESDPDTLSVETSIAALEDMTVTELKHKFSTYLLQVKEARILNETPDLSKPSDEQSHGDTKANKPNPRDVDSQAEFEANSQVLAEMAKASVDADFRDESTAMMHWFRVLSNAEKAAIFYKMGEDMQKNADWTRFFATIQNYRASMLPTTLPEASHEDGKLDGRPHVARAEQPVKHARKPTIEERLTEKLFAAQQKPFWGQKLATPKPAATPGKTSSLHLSREEVIAELKRFSLEFSFDSTELQRMFDYRNKSKPHGVL